MEKDGDIDTLSKTNEAMEKQLEEINPKITWMAGGGGGGLHIHISALKNRHSTAPNGFKNLIA